MRTVDNRLMVLAQILRGAVKTLRKSPSVRRAPDLTNAVDSIEAAASELETLAQVPVSDNSGEGPSVIVPRLTGCCQDCGRAPTIEMSRVNETVCISVVPHPECIHAAARFNLWPVAPSSLPEESSTDRKLEWIDENVCEIVRCREHDGVCVHWIDVDLDEHFTEGPTIGDAITKAMAEDAAGERAGVTNGAE